MANYQSGTELMPAGQVILQISWPVISDPVTYLISSAFPVVQLVDYQLVMIAIFS